MQPQSKHTQLELSERAGGSRPKRPLGEVVRFTNMLQLHNLREYLRLFSHRDCLDKK